MNEDVQSWVEYATVDLRAAEVLYDADLWGQTCFHAQQCVEKMLKAALIAHGKGYPRIHNIVELLALLDEDTANKLADVAAEAGSLDEFYIPTRYPEALAGVLPDRMPEREDATEALDLARRIFAIMQGVLQQQ
ncbi:MAG: HEPN domain-containing protein [Chloroflexota bacterium]|nr:HEPN domain-containing protein [Chloroflexota bacterium]